MNYAWAIALIIIVGVAIFGLNIGGIRNSLSSQSSQLTQAGEQVSIIGYTCTSGAGNITVSLQNNGAGLVKDINVSFINESQSTSLSDCAGTPDIFPAQTQICRSNVSTGLRCAPVGQTYELMVTIVYIDDISGITYRPTRNITGTVQQS